MLNDVFVFVFACFSPTMLNSSLNILDKCRLNCDVCQKSGMLGGLGGMLGGFD